MSTPAANLTAPQAETTPLRFVTAASLFDGHDAAINIMRRLIQAQGAEVIHLGHNRSVEDVVRAALQEAGVDYDSAEASWVPNLQVPLDLDGAKKMIRVIEALEDSDDVQNVWANGDISDEVLGQLEEE